MASRNLWCGVLIVVVSFFLCMPAEAQNSDFKLPGPSTGEVVGIVVGVTAAVAVVVTVVVIHYSKKRTITGCVSSGADGMSITDEKDKQIYALSGNTVGATPGDRMKLQGKKVKAGPDKRVMWVATNVAKDFGVCQP
jgi:hypothetical protein